MSYPSTGYLPVIGFFFIPILLRLFATPFWVCFLDLLMLFRVCRRERRILFCVPLREFRILFLVPLREFRILLRADFFFLGPLLFLLRKRTGFPRRRYTRLFFGRLDLYLFVFAASASSPNPAAANTTPLSNPRNFLRESESFLLLHFGEIYS